MSIINYNIVTTSYDLKRIKENGCIICNLKIFKVLNGECICLKCNTSYVTDINKVLKKRLLKP